MASLGIVYGCLFYFATLVLVFGLARKIIQYARTPAPLKISLTPAPKTHKGVILRLLREVIVFESLFKSNKWIWLFGWLFHFSLLLVLLRHLWYFTDPVWTWVLWMQPLGYYATYGMLIGLAGLWARRFVVDRIRYISSLSDHLMLALLISIGISGAMIKFLGHTDILQVKTFIQGLMTFEFNPLSAETRGDALLLIHLALVITLILIFPFSKLLHAPGVFFSPTLNQPDNPRERRYIAKWAANQRTVKSK